MLYLQRVAGNQAVLQLLRDRDQATTSQPPVVTSGQPFPTRQLQRVSRAKDDRYIQRKPNNPVYEEFCEETKTGKGITFPSFDEYMGHLDKSIAEGRPLAFIVNAILPYSDVAEIPNVIASIREGFSGAKSRVAFVFGVNAFNTNEEGLKASLQKANELIEKLDVPVALVPSTFAPKYKIDKKTGEPKLKFPYGSERNKVLHSAETTRLVHAFAAHNFHPYISFQDFDTGKRTVPSQEHIFDYMENKLSFEHGDLKSESGEKEIKGESIPPLRPLMMSGGYRPTEGLWQETKKKFPSDKYKSDEPPEEFKELLKKIGLDMEARTRLSKIHPLLPYSPEPNLFMDALPLLLATKDSPLEFGQGGAEFNQLGMMLNMFLGKELQWYFSNLLKSAQESTPVPSLPIKQASDIPSGSFQWPEPEKGQEIEIGEEFLIEDEIKMSSLERDDIFNSFSQYSQTNTHPLRGQSYFVDFEGGAIQTDLVRLATDYLTGPAKLPQSHEGLTTAVDRFFINKSAKSGVSFDQIKKDFWTQDSKPPTKKRKAEPKDSKQKSPQELLNEKLNFPKPKKKMPKRNKMSSAISHPIETGDFKGMDVGIPLESRETTAFTVATSEPFSMLLKNLQFLQFAYPQLPVHDGSLYDALSSHPDATMTAIQIRNRVVEWALKHLEQLQTVLEYMHPEVLFNAIAYTGSARDQEYDPIARMVAQVCNVDIEVHYEGKEDAVTVQNPIDNSHPDNRIAVDLMGVFYTIRNEKQIIS